ncbi:MAG TPA: hypothetical protein VH854_14230 [Thermoanaerobaculia bacterium]|jgi:hypothetical protein|nr:hypothetical protein [Thermoanaerobaculia bacterium]
MKSLRKIASRAARRAGPVVLPARVLALPVDDRFDIYRNGFCKNDARGKGRFCPESHFVSG